MTDGHLLVFGLGYTGRAVAALAVADGLRVTATSRDPAGLTPPPGVALCLFDAASPALATATHVLSTAAPGEDGDPVLARFGAELAATPARWLGYLSTTGVYGDRAGGWVDESTPPAPGQDRSRRRLAAEQAWRRAAGPARALDLFRLAGIYGPGRSVLDDLRQGRARHVLRPGHRFGRIHLDDIAAAVLAAVRQPVPPGVRVFNLADDEPAESAQVVLEAARLLGVEPPPPTPFRDSALSPMARSFWAENRQVASHATQAALGLRWRYPSFREGLRAIQQAEQQTAEQGEVPGG